MDGDSFSAALEIVDGNPYVLVPAEILERLFHAADRSNGPIPICGLVNGAPYRQTLVRFRGSWRLYVNMQMLEDSPRRIGEVVDLTVHFDPSDRSIQPHPKLVAMLDATPSAKAVFDAMAPSRRHEIVRYLDSLKTEEAIERNVSRARDFLLGNGPFVGRQQP